MRKNLICLGLAIAVALVVSYPANASESPPGNPNVMITAIDTSPPASSFTIDKAISEGSTFDANQPISQEVQTDVAMIATGRFGDTKTMRAMVLPSTAIDANNMSPAVVRAISLESGSRPLRL